MSDSIKENEEANNMQDDSQIVKTEEDAENEDIELDEVELGDNSATSALKMKVDVPFETSPTEEKSASALNPPVAPVGRQQTERTEKPSHASSKKSSKVSNKQQQQQTEGDDLDGDASPYSSAKILQDPSMLPRDARFISLLLKTEGIKDFDMNVVPQLLEFMHGYACDILKDAHVYMKYANHKEMTLDDIRLSVEARISHSFTMPPTREINMRLFEEINSKPIPIIPYTFGVILPPEIDTLTGTNFQISIGKNKIKRKFFHDPGPNASPPSNDSPTSQKQPYDKGEEESDIGELILTLDPANKKENDNSDDNYDGFI